ncbi:MAG: NADH-quinone oxidoreductase subunit C [Deltaproteobacteria bacterium]|nr:NADH-quinone oxidoreductase subunit C [Deltaproteobacteria bacterium]TLN03355.1 MAG: NADH-quinone oxidoreductase subunit C [bacterium]
MKDSVVVINEENTPELSPDRIITQTRILKDEGFRFVTMSSTDLGDSICVLYHLDKDLQLINLKVEVPKGSKIPSICSVYASAVLIENEIKEHFGVEFDGLSLDFQGMLYLDEEVQKTPFCKIGINRV